MSSRRSITSVAKELGLRDSVLRRWVDKLRQEPASAAWRPTTQASPMPADQASEIARLRQENERLRMERDIFRKVDRDLCRNPDMSFRFIEDHRDTYPSTDVRRARGLTGRLLCLARSPGERADKIQCIAPGCDSADPSPQQRTLRASPGSMPLCGRRDVVPAAAGSNGCGIRAIMAPPRRVRTTDSRHGLPIAPNLVARDFMASAPNRVWLADITCIPTAQGWLYLAASWSLQPKDRRLGHEGSYPG